MKISVDTKHDTHEDIRKVISLLQHLIGEQQVAQMLEQQAFGQTPQQDSPAATGMDEQAAAPADMPGLFNIFAEEPQPQVSSTVEQYDAAPAPEQVSASDEEEESFRQVFRVQQEEKQVDFPDKILPYDD